jgi:hypothetical protein
MATDDKLLNKAVDVLTQIDAKLEQIITQLVTLESFLETTKQAWEAQKAGEQDQVLEGEEGASPES